MLFSEMLMTLERVSREDAGMYSEVKTDAIHKYDDTNMDDNGYPQTDYSAVVEWQKKGKSQNIAGQGTLPLSTL